MKASALAFRAFWLLYLVFVVILFAVLLKGCVSSHRAPHQELPPMLKAKEATIEQALFQPISGAISSAMTVLAPNEGKIWATYGTSVCHPTGGVNPYIFIPLNPTHPRVGDEVKLLFATRALRPFPVEDMYLVWSNKLLDQSIDFTPFGMPGCQMLIDPQLIVRIPADQEMSGMVTHVAGTGEALLKWTAPAWSAGMRLYVQMLTLSPGETPAGYISSHCVEVLIGS
jgi:hypothetical protein